MTVPKNMRGFSSAIINSGMAIGLAIGLGVAGPVYLFFNNWRAPFLSLAIPTMLVALIYQAVMRDARPAEKVTVPWSEILGNKNLMLLNVAIFCSQYGFWTVLTWGPTFFMAERGLSLTVSGLYTAIVAVTAIPAGIWFGRNSDRFGRKKLALIILPLTALTVAAMGYVMSLPMLVAALIAYGIVGKFSFDPVSVSWVGDHVARTNPEAMGTAIAVFNMSGMLSSIAAPVVVGWIRDITGSFVGGFYLGAVILLIGMVVVAFIDETVEEKKTASA
ncbi:MAG: MFS transporter [Clostridia bacterium]|nr:MFS transporter [Clostridia bacterium]